LTSHPGHLGAGSDPKEVSTESRFLAESLQEQGLPNVSQFSKDEESVPHRIHRQNTLSFGDNQTKISEDRM